MLREMRTSATDVITYRFRAFIHPIAHAISLIYASYIFARACCICGDTFPDSCRCAFPSPCILCRAGEIGKDSFIGGM